MRTYVAIFISNLNKINSSIVSCPALKNPRCSYNSAFLKDLPRDIQRKVIRINNTFHKAQVSWELNQNKAQIIKITRNLFTKKEAKKDCQEAMKS